MSTRPAARQTRVVIRGQGGEAISLTRARGPKIRLRAAGLCKSYLEADCWPYRQCRIVRVGANERMCGQAMAPEEAKGVPAQFKVNLPSEQEAGHYADFASVWHNPESFILDFIAMTRPPQPEDAEDGSKVAVVNCRVVSRIRIPPAQMFELMKALERQLTAWEQETSRRRTDLPPDLPTL